MMNSESCFFREVCGDGVEPLFLCCLELNRTPAIAVATSVCSEATTVTVLGLVGGAPWGKTPRVAGAYEIAQPLRRLRG